MSQQTIPVIDLNSFLQGDAKDREKFVTSVGEALSDVGFFALENHGVDKKVIDKVYELAWKFFSLPEDIKLKYQDVGASEPRGFGAFAREHVKGEDIPDPKEFWHVGRELLPNSPLNKVYPHNIWPAEIPGFKPAMLAMYRQLEVCTRHILEAISLYICEEAQFLPGMMENGNTVLRLLHYPPMEENHSVAPLRCAAHEDIDLITLLCGATEEGLEILQKDGTWLPVHAIPGQIIVDAGDMLQNLTNGLLKSTTHRVRNPDQDRNRRFSIPYFVHPRPDVDLSPRPNCLEETGGEAIYSNITAGEYFLKRLQEIGLAKVSPRGH